MRIIGYCRVSTEEQASEGVSLDVQRSKITAYCDLHELELVEVFVDAGESGKSLKREGIQEALTALRKGRADSIVVFKLDRLSRSIADWQTLIDGYFGERPGKQLLSVSDSIDTRSAAGRLVLNILLAASQWEREAIGERTRDALQHKIRRKERVGSIRFGYDLAADGRTLLENPDEQEAIQLIYKLRADGWSLRAIAAELERRGIRTKEGKTSWTHTTVSRILARAA